MREIVACTSVSADVAPVWSVVRDFGEGREHVRITTDSRGLAEHGRRVGAAHPGGVR